MLRIRLTRTGKKNRPSYRIVVAEHTAPIQGKFIEVVGFYNPIENPKQLEFKEDRIKYWISVGAKPTDTVASLLKSKGMEGMDEYIAPRDKQRKKKGEEEEAPEASAPAAEGDDEAAPTEEAPAEEVADEPAAAEAPAEEKPEEAKDEPKEEKAEEEAKDEPAEEAKEEAPSEEEDKKEEEAA